MSKNYRHKKKIQNFIEKRLEGKLKKDQINLKILSEGDLQSCVYYHLRKFIDKNKIANWHLINKLPMGKKTESKKFPDIAVVYTEEAGKRVYPSFLLELKEDYRNFKPNRVARDLKKLSTLAKKHGNAVEQTYFIYSLLDKKHSPTEVNKMISDMNPNKDGYLFPMTINIIGEKQYPREIENFEKKVQKLRKFRSG